jgi:hypothetical protein
MNRSTNLGGVMRRLVMVIFIGLSSLMAACSTMAPPTQAIAIASATPAAEVPVINHDVTPRVIPAVQDVAPSASVLSLETLDHTALSPPETEITYVRVAPDRASIECMATTLYAEARGEGDKGMIAVGFVIVNRTKDGRFPTTVCEVVKQKTVVKNRKTARMETHCQFSFFTPQSSCQKSAIKVHDPAAYQKAMELAKAVLCGEVINPIDNCLYFHNVHVRSPKPVLHASRKRIGLHYFYA